MNAQPGAVEIHECTLYSVDGKKKHNLLGQVTVISIYEDITKPYICADFIIADGIELLNNFPILGEEYVVLEFSTPGSDPVEYEFHIVDVIGTSATPTNNMRTYALRGTSKEYKMNGMLFTKRYTDTVENIISNVLMEKLKTNKSFNYEKTKGTQDLVIPKLRPFEAIDMVRLRAVSDEHKSSAFCFFENRDGYNLFTFEKLIKEGKKSVEKQDRQFFLHTTAMTDATQTHYRNIIAYELPQNAGTGSRINSGALNSTVRSFDFMTGEYRDTEYKNAEQQEQFASTDDAIVARNTPTFESVYGAKPARRFFVAVDSTKPDTFVETKWGPLNAFLDKLKQNALKLHVYGDSTMTVGQVIKVTMPEVHGGTGERESDRRSSGNYLIGRLRHIIMNQPTPKHTMSIEGVKINFGEPQ